MRSLRRFWPFALAVVLCGYAALKFRAAATVGLRPAVESVADDASFGALMAYGIVTKSPALSRLVLLCEAPLSNFANETPEERRQRWELYATEAAFYAAELKARGNPVYNRVNSYVWEGKYPVIYLRFHLAQNLQVDGFPTAETQSCWARRGYSTYRILDFRTGEVIR